MKTFVLILATNSGSREDGSVDYSDYLLVSSDTLKFDEPIFKSEFVSVKEFGANAEAVEAYDEKKDNEWDAPDVSRAKIVEHIQSLGYTVEDASVHILWASGYDT